VQLIINALSGSGCADFNTVLGPLSGPCPCYFRSLCCLLGTCCHIDLLAGQHYLYSWQFSQNSCTYSTLLKEDSMEETKGCIIVIAKCSDRKLQLACPTMGCIACVNKISTHPSGNASLQIVSHKRNHG
jgi:hypothetical protein